MQPSNTTKILQDLELLPLSLIKTAKYCGELLITDKTSEKCVLAALSTLPGALTGGLTAVLFSCNIVMFVGTGALISSITLLGLNILVKPFLKERLGSLTLGMRMLIVKKEKQQAKTNVQAQDTHNAYTEHVAKIPGKPLVQQTETELDALLDDALNDLDVD